MFNLSYVLGLHPSYAKQQVRDFTSDFEHEAYLTSHSRTDYDRRIEKGLNDIVSNAFPVPPDSIVQDGSDHSVWSTREYFSAAPDDRTP